MAISFNTGATASNGTTGASTQPITIPAGVLAGDVILVIASAFNIGTSALTITASSTGTAPVQIGSTVTTPVFSSNVCSTALFYVVAGASDAGKVITIGGGAGNTQWAVGLAAYTGASNSAPIDVSGSATSSGASATITCPTEVTGVAGDWDIQIAAAALGGSSFAGGGGFTQREALSDALSGCTVLIYDSNASVGGAGTNIGGAVFTNTGHNNWWAGWTVGLAPAGSSNVTASFGLAMAPLKQSFTAAETISGHFGLAMAPLKQSFTAAEQGANISAHFSLAMAPLKMQFAQPSLVRAGPPHDDPGFKRFRRRRLR